MPQPKTKPKPARAKVRGAVPAPAPPPPDVPAQVLQFVGDVVAMLAREPEPEDMTELVAIAVRMSEHDRRGLIRIIRSNA